MSEAVFASLPSQGGLKTNYQIPKRAEAAIGDTRLGYLDIFRPGETTPHSELAGLRVVVIGAGPAGLVHARNAARYGAAVTVVERAGDPRGEDSGYTNRSFNITIDNVGRQVLGDPSAWHGGIWLSGRAIHNFHGRPGIGYADYGSTPDARLISIPRPMLRQNLCGLAEEAGARILFRSRAVSANPHTGVVRYESPSGRSEEIYGDLVVFCDGLHSLADTAADSHEIKIWSECRNYISGLILPEHNRGLSLGHIHFWHEPDGENFTVGIPNGDGSMALLIVSQFTDIAPDNHPFATIEAARQRLKTRFPRLYAEAPELAEQLPRHRRGTFCYKTSKRYRLGTKGVIVGDACLVFPPWAGYGANQAMYGAASLVQALVTHQRSLERALTQYEAQQQHLSDALIAFVNGQGDFLSGPVANDPGGRGDPALGPIIEYARRQNAAV